MLATTDYTQQLKALMQQANLSSYRRLAAEANVSQWQVQQLRKGQAASMRVAALIQLSQALQISLSSLLNYFGVAVNRETVVNSDVNENNEEILSDGNKIEEEKEISVMVAEAATETEVLRAEYERLKQQSAQQLESARSQFQLDALRTLETWLVQWPTIAKRAAQRGADLPAEKILPFVRPVETLMMQWGVEAIAPVDSQVPYDPQRHQLTGATAGPGEQVVVTHSGAAHKDKLLHRAKVKRV